MMILRLLGWIGWAVLLVITTPLTFDAVYRPLTEGMSYSFAFNTIILLWWILLAWTYYHGKFNKLHLFWLAPLAWVLSDHGTTYSFILLQTHAAVFFIVLFGWIVVLWWLTPYPIVCPHCKSDGCRRSRRMNLCEQLFSWAGIRPFRCENCNQRFWRIGKIISVKISSF